MSPILSFRSSPLESVPMGIVLMTVTAAFALPTTKFGPEVARPHYGIERRIPKEERHNRLLGFFRHDHGSYFALEVEGCVGIQRSAGRDYVVIFQQPAAATSTLAD